jgi:hypothetical protein
MTSLTNRLIPQGWIEIIQMRVQSFADLLQRRHEPDQHGDLDRQIDEARWNIVAAVQQMPPPQHGEQAERPGKPVYTPEDLAEAWGCTTRAMSAGSLMRGNCGRSGSASSIDSRPQRCRSLSGRRRPAKVQNEK